MLNKTRCLYLVCYRALMQLPLFGGEYFKQLGIVKLGAAFGRATAAAKTYFRYERRKLSPLFFPPAN